MAEYIFPTKGLTETKLVNGEMVVVRKVSYTAGDKTWDAEKQYYKKASFGNWISPVGIRVGVIMLINGWVDK